MLARRMAVSVTASVSASASASVEGLRFVDIGVNLTDPVFRGLYHGKRAHEDDFDQMMTRARAAGVRAQIVTGGSLSESKRAQELADQFDDLYCTVGCHPTRSAEFGQAKGGPAAYLEELAKVIEKNLGGVHAVSTEKGKGKVVAVGECGLDYDRLHFAPAEVQRVHFGEQLSLAARFRLPLFLHSRAAHDDFVSILRPRLAELRAAIGAGAGSRPSPSPSPRLTTQVDGGVGGGGSAPAASSEGEGEGRQEEAQEEVGRVGVVHSFTGTMEEMKELVQMGLFIGVNGCSLKTEENLEVVREIPLDRLMLETDAPWCEPRPIHASSPHLASFAQTHANLHALFSPPQTKKEKFKPGSAVKGRAEPCMIGGIAAVVAGVKGVPVQVVAQAAQRNTEWVFGIGS